MKLGTQTGSLINHVTSRMTVGQPAPVVGMGCTVLMWSDRSPATIFRVFKVGKASTVIEVRDDRVRCVGPAVQYGEQGDYETAINVKGRSRYFQQSGGANSPWVSVCKNEVTGRWNKTGGNGLRIGERDHYRDPSF